MASKRKGKGNSIPSIEESFFGITSKQKVQGATSRPRKRKVRVIDSATNLKDTMPSRVKRRATSDSVLLPDKQQTKGGFGLADLKIEAFDFFQQMLNHCCGTHVFDVVNTASILKQFTPDVMKAVIYVLAENSKRLSPKVLTEAQTQTLDKTAAEEHHDTEISDITSKAGRKLAPSKWQPIPELVQPRLTSPVSNSCSPVSAAVQALMSFARNEGQIKNRGEEPATAIGTSKPSGDANMKSPERDQVETTANLHVFDKVSLAPVSSSPFLQPMSSSLMLHTEVKKSPSFSETTASDKELISRTDSPHNVKISFGGSSSPSFPWIKQPIKADLLVKSDETKSTDKNLPSISSILAPIGSSFSDLSFRNLQMLGTSAAPHNNPSFTVTSRITDPQKNSLPPMGVIVSGLNPHKNADQNVTGSPVLNNRVNHLTDARRAPTTSSSLLVSTSIANLTGFDSTLKVSPKTVFRKILPKPNKKRRVEEEIGQYHPLIGDTEDNVEISESEFSKDLNEDMKLSTDIGLLVHDSPPTQEVIKRNAPLLRPEKHDIVDDSSGLSTENFRQETSDSENALKSPLASVISNVRQQGFVVKSMQSDQSSVVLPKSKKTSNSNSGKLEVASALLSMGSTENETKALGKVVSPFNKEKSMPDIRENTAMQHGDILYTKTGTFQIEDIEIDPKKNKIEKGLWVYLNNIIKFPQQ